MSFFGDWLFGDDGLIDKVIAVVRRNSRKLKNPNTPHFYPDHPEVMNPPLAPHVCFHCGKYDAEERRTPCPGKRRK